MIGSQFRLRDVKPITKKLLEWDLRIISICTPWAPRGPKRSLNIIIYLSRPLRKLDALGHFRPYLPPSDEELCYNKDTYSVKCSNFKTNKSILIFSFIKYLFIAKTCLIYLFFYLGWIDGWCVAHPVYLTGNFTCMCMFLACNKIKVQCN